MRKFTLSTFKSIFVWVVTFALTLLLSMGSAYAYFTATAQKKQSSATTGIIKIGLSDTTLSTTASGSLVSTKIVPGSQVAYSGIVQNTGTANMYAVLECSVYVDNTLVQTAYYTADGTQLVYSNSSNAYTTEATPIAVGGSKTFILYFTFDTTYGNEYKNKSAQLKVVAYGIQQSHLTALEATNILLNGTGGGTISLPSTYTQLEYVEMNGKQWFDTDFQVTADTDNFIVETSVKWTNTAKRQLMGYSSNVSGYFGINANGKYEIGANTGVGISASTTSFDNLKVIRNKTNSIWAFYVNNNLLKKYGAPDGRSGKFQVGCLVSYSEYANYCKMKYFNIYQDGVVKYNLVPAKNSAGVAGMYDTVNDKFYTSTSGTAFIAGPEV